MNSEENNSILNRNFILVLIGQIISMFGNVMFKIIMSLYILDITQSASIFGSILAISMIPTIIISPIGGIIADRFNRRNIMVILDFFTAFLIFGYGYFIEKGNVDNIIVVTTILLLLLSVIQALYQPAVNSSIPLLQKKDNIVKANAIVNQVLIFANLIGPVLGGMVYGVLKIEYLIFISAICFFLSAVLEIFIVIPFIKNNWKENSIIKVLKEDFVYSIKYVFKERSKTFKFLLAVGIYAAIVNGVCIIGLPYLIRVMLGLSSDLYGISEGAVSAAGILGGVVLSMLGEKIKFNKLYLFLLAAGIIFIPMTLSIYIDMGAIVKYISVVICFMLIQFVATIFSVYVMSMLQKSVPENIIGKISAYFTTVTMIAQPIGQGVYGGLFEVLKTQIFLVTGITSIVIILMSFYIKKITTNLEL